MIGVGERDHGMQILAASSSYYRQTCYREMLESLGHAVRVASGGVECIEQFWRHAPEVLVLETPLLWGGSDGVLAVLNESAHLASLPVIVVSVNQGSADWFQLSRFACDDFLARLPTREELQRSIERCKARLARPHFLSGGLPQDGAGAAAPVAADNLQ